MNTDIRKYIGIIENAELTERKGSTELMHPRKFSDDDPFRPIEYEYDFEVGDVVCNSMDEGGDEYFRGGDAPVGVITHIQDGAYVMDDQAGVLFQFKPLFPDKPVPSWMDPPDDAKAWALGVSAREFVDNELPFKKYVRDPDDDVCWDCETETGYEIGVSVCPCPEESDDEDDDSEY